VTKGDLLYEGKGKRLFFTENNEQLIAEFKDDLTAFNAQKRGNEDGKGALNNQISTFLFQMLEKEGIKTHFIDTIDKTHMLVKKVEIIPIEVVIRNVATGSLTKRLGIADGTKLSQTIVEFYLKDDDLNDPIINDEHALVMNLVKSEKEIETLKTLGRKINTILVPFFATKELRLIDFKLEFGRDSEGNILLSDEISPDSCRFWDVNSGEKLDKDRFRQGLGDVKLAYEEVLNRMIKEDV
jgi:phosphoribosylaminoimidazole-succinocarboxamide synthase